jgi:hypothetical protein
MWMQSVEIQANTVDWTTVLLAVIALIGSMITAVLAYLAQREAKRAVAVSQTTGQRVDGRMDELLSLTKDLAHAEGAAAGEQAQRDRDDNKVPDRKATPY